MSFVKSQQTHLVFGVFIFTSAIFLLISFYSFLMHWKEDQSILANFSDKSFSANNLLGIGAIGRIPEAWTGMGTPAGNS